MSDVLRRMREADVEPASRRAAEELVGVARARGLVDVGV